MSKPVSYNIVEDGRVLLSRDAKLSELRGPDKSVLDPDLQVKIDKQVWGVNRCVVRLCSRLIDDMMDTNMADANSNQIPLDPSNVPPDVFEQILDLLYDGWVLVQAGDMVDILASSNFLKYTELAQACLSFLQEHLGVNVLTKAWEYSNLNLEAAAGLLEVCHQKIPGLFEVWSEMECFCNLGFDKLFAVVEIAQLRNKNRNENKILEAIVRWLHFDWAGRCRYINEMLAKVQWRRVNSGRAIECDLVRNICQTKMGSVEAREAKFLLLQAIGLGPDGDFEGLFGVKVSEAAPEHVVAGILNNSGYEIVLSTFNDNTHSLEKKETVAIPAEMRGRNMTLSDMCSVGSRLYMLAEVDREPVYVLYEYDHKSRVFQYAVLHPPFGREPFGDSNSTRLFLDDTRVIITNEVLYGDVVVYYTTREELVFSQNPHVYVVDAVSTQLLAVDVPVRDDTRGHHFSALAFDDVAGRLYFCFGMFVEQSNRVFYLDLQSKARVWCPDYPLKLCYFAAAVHEGSLLVAGGMTKNDQTSSKVRRLDKDGSDWIELPSMNEKHMFGSLLVKNDRLYYMNTNNTCVDLETLDLTNPQGGWNLGKNPKKMFSLMRSVRAFLD